MGKIKICYGINDNPSKTFLVMIPDDSTVEGLLNLISKKQAKTYTHLYLDNSELALDDIVSEFYEENQIYIASTEDKPPSSSFINSLRESKGMSAVTISTPEKPSTPSKIDTSSPSKPIKPVILPKIPGSPKGSKNPLAVMTPALDENQGVDKSTMKNQREGGIESEVIPSAPRAVSGKFQFYFTGSTKEYLLDGIEVDLDVKMTPNQVRDYLHGQLAGKVDMRGKQLIVYLSGGLPFISGTLGDLMLHKDYAFENVIYGVITRQVSDAVLNRLYPELCNVSDPERELLISPLCNSTQLGLSDMACLLSYLNHDGVKGDLLLRTCATIINFAPLTTSMNRIICRNGVDGRCVITVTSTLYTFFRAFIPSTTSDDKVYEYALRMCNLISHINNPPEKLPMQTIEVKGDSKTKFLSDLKLGPIVYIWKGDVGEKFERRSFSLQGENAIINAYNIIASFKPIAPLSMRLVSSCSIVKGKDHEYLYLMQSPSKKVMDQNKVDIIDPFTGMTQSVDVEYFAIQQENNSIDKVDDLIDPDNVLQIIMVNFDESDSMNWNLEGKSIKDNGKTFSRFSISYQYLTTFANRTYGYRIPCIQGLISFGNNVTTRCPLSPLCPDFEDKGLKNLKPKGVTKLWDSLDKACDDIINFRKDKDGNEKFKNAVSRILVISDGEDVRSTSKPIDIVPKLVKNKIIVDCIIASTKDSCKELSSICHITGGLALRPESVNEGLQIFEQGAFLNYNERKQNITPVIKGDRNTTPSKIAKNVSIITPDFLAKAKEQAYFDKPTIQNKDILIGTSRENLATPAHQCSANMNSHDPIPRNRRILRELHAAAEINDSRPENTNYDADLKVYSIKVHLDKWKVFIKGPVNTPYENKWWHLIVNFPPTYPIDPPVIRFVSIPYHLNVSFEGRICLNCLEKGYMSTKHVVEILQEIKELFLLPQKESAIQLEKLDLYNNNYPEYERLARLSTLENAKDDFNDYINSNIDDSVDDKFTLNLAEHVPPYMISQVSGNKIKDPVISSTGVYYEREELKQIISSNKNPICIITGKQLTENLEDIDAL